MMGAGDLGISPARYDLLLQTLVSKPIYTVRCELRTRSGQHVRWLPDVTDGQVEQWPGGGRSCSLTVNDLHRSLRQIEGTRAGQYLINVDYRVFTNSDDLGPAWVDCPLMTDGVVAKADREGPNVTITGAGKTRLANHTAGSTFVVPKGIRKVDAIARILVNLCGWDRSTIDLGNHPSVLRDAFAVHPMQSPWRRCLDLAGQLDPPITLAVNGVGTLKGRAFAKDTAMKMSTADWLTSTPVVQRDFRRRVNRYVLHWGGDDHRAPIVEELPPSHANSAHALAVNGQPQWYVAEAHMPHVKSKATAVRIAKTRLKRAQTVMETVKAECLPLPLLEAGDRIRIVSRDGAGSPVIDTWTVPFAPGEMMTLGWTDARAA